MSKTYSLILKEHGIPVIEVHKPSLVQCLAVMIILLDRKYNVNLIDELARFFKFIPLRKPENVKIVNSVKNGSESTDDRRTDGTENTTTGTAKSQSL